MMSSSYKLDGLLEWRCIGPFRGGRVVAVAGDPSDMNRFYFGACAGGVWKTSDGGTYWENVSDGFFKTGSVGALAVAESDPNVIYAGMGETTIRIDVSHGDGVYKSTDAGKTWQHMGLADTRAIAKIRVHPTNPDLVYVAALGHPFGDNEERGVFRSQNGGKTWEKVLYRSEKAGAIDLTMDASNPRILYAAIWETRRSFWDIKSGGPDSSLYKSTDGGDSWTEITANEGLPQGPLGKIGISASPAQSGRVWALVEAKDGGLFRSDDGGAKWEKVSDDERLCRRHWYFTHITADTQDPETVYVLTLRMWKSVNGGRTFTEVTTPHADNHDLWIDPNNAQRMIQGNDGGACVSFNGGDTFSSTYNQPTAQFYHLAVDNQHPYRVYGTQQDNTSISVPSQSDGASISWADCYLAGKGESGYIAVRPDDPNIIYVGAIGSSPGGGNALQRYDHRTKQIRLITTWPEQTRGYGAEDYKYRFAWTYPIVLSPHDPNVLYVTGNHVFRSTDEGTSWEILSPGLTRADPETLKPSGGPINLDAIGAETYATIYAFVESQHEPGVFWGGSDDGLIHLSKDGGQTWHDVTPPELPEWTMISMIEQSPHDPATVYVAATRYKLDDYQPYLYKTTDYGDSWQKITDGLPSDDFTRAIREDPAREGLLYVGTETGLYLSFNGGDSWQSFQLNLPVTPIHDLLIKENDLIVATHGRSFWILDDLTPLHQLSDAVYDSDAHLFTPRPTIRTIPSVLHMSGGSPGKNYRATSGEVTPFIESKTPEGRTVRRFLDAGENPPRGVIITYYLKEQPSDQICLTILDAEGNEIKTFESKGRTRIPACSEDKNKLYLPANAGMNRFIWNLRYPDGATIAGKDISADKPTGPIAPPSSYQLQLNVGEQTLNASFELLKDPRVTTTQEDFDAQFDLLMRIRDKHGATNSAINQIRDLKAQLNGWVDRLSEHSQKEPITQAADALKAKLQPIEETFIMPGLKTRSEVINHRARLATKLASLRSVVASADFAPTKASYQVFDYLSAQIDTQLNALQELIANDVAAFNQLIQQAQAPALVPKA
ncbi:MAG: WD40/YVTN/BNR-like repeat-containing protein [Ardenticatenaceae bacterium]